MANLQAVATKSTINYKEKVRQTATAEKSLRQTKDQLAVINELIQNRAAVLEKAKTNVAEAQAIAQTSAKVLKEKQAEHQRLEREAKPKGKTSDLQSLSVFKPKEEPKAQALTYSEPRKIKQVAKAPESLPQTGEQQSIWLTIIGLFMAAGAISFKNKRRKNS